MEQRIVQGILDELREPLSEGYWGLWARVHLHVIVFDNRWCGMEIRTGHEGVSGGGIDALRSP